MVYRFFLLKNGSFGIKRTENRILFIINQADLELMYKIRSLLGFGVVRTFKQNGRLYARYIVADQNGINKLIALFNGNIHLEKVHLRFTNWIHKYNQIYNENIIVKSRLMVNLISLNTGWIAEFFDAVKKLATQKLLLRSKSKPLYGI
jgi:hypothetical protein